MKKILTLLIATGWLVAVKGEISINSLVSCVCEGEQIQAFELVAEGSAGPFTFNWSGPDGYTSTEQNPTDIQLTGTYLVEVINTYSCVTSFSTSLHPCPGIESLDFEVQPNCPSNGGNILTTITGGTLPFQYEWSNGVTGIADLYNIAAGNYSLTVTDANGCAIEGNVEVLIPENPPFDILGEVNHACNEDDGYIMLDMDGIAQPYTIQWSLPGETEYRIGDLTNGNYYVTVTDANGCTGTEMFTIYGAPSFDHLVFPETCEPANDGHIELTANNDSNTEEMTIQWSDGVTNELIRTGLDAGIYSVTITGNTSGCSVIKDNLSTHPTANSGEAPYLKSLKILASEGGVETLIYQGDWIESTSGCVQFQGGSQNLSQELVDAMGSGSVSWKALATYNQTVSIGTLVFTSQGNSFPLGINQTSNTQLLPLGSAQVALLVGSSGSFDITIESFASSPLGGATLNMYDYSASLTNCVDIPSINPANCEYEPPLDPVYIGSDPTHSFSFSCIDVTMVTNGDDTFCVDIGSTPEEHIQAVSWSINGGNWMPSPSNDLCLEVTPDVFGEYCALIKVVTGSTECAVKVCATYCAPPTNLNIIETVTDPSCTSASDGSICLDVTSDDVPLLISWETGEVESCIGDLAAGIYYYTLSPGEECDLMPGYPSAPHPIELGIDNTSLNIIEALTPSCAPGPGNGQACIYGSGGTPPYDIHWYDGTTFNCVTQLVPGSYDYTVSDACGATIEGSVEIEAITSGDVAVALPGPDEDACVSHLQFYLTSPTVLTVIITHNGSGAEFTQVFPASGGVPHHVLFEGILPGDYTVEIFDQCHNILQTFQEPVEDRDVNLISGIKHHDFIRCEGGTGMFTVTLTDEGTLPYSILWSNGATTETIEGLTPGIYTVTVTDNNGCTSSHGLTMYVDDPLTIEDETTSACNEDNGSIILDVNGGVPPYDFEWSNEQTGQNSISAAPGEYCVTVTDAEGCIVTDCYTITAFNLEVVNATIMNHECGIGEGCNGGIDLTVNSSAEINYLWSDGTTMQDVSEVCDGQYEVTITSGNCVEVRTYEVGADIEDDWDFDDIVKNNFYNNSAGNDAAEIWIYSDLFNDFFWGGELIVSYDQSMLPIIGSDFNFVANASGRRIEVVINEDYADYEHFYLEYIASNGCVFRGEIGPITECAEGEIEGIRFDLNHIGDELQACEEGHSNVYEIDVDQSQLGNNYPYRIYVSMGEATYPSEADYQETILVEEGFHNPITITGVPAGVVRFRGYDACGNVDGPQSTFATHDNCCDLSAICGIVSQEETNFSGSSYEYKFKYLTLHTIGSGSCFEPEESNLIIDNPLGGGVPGDVFSWVIPDVCWTGRIEITIEGTATSFSMALLEVVPENSAYNRVNILEGDNNWNPTAAGSYTVTMTYTGTGGSLGVDCEDVIPITYHDNGSNGGDVIGFINGLWWENSLPQVYEDAYYAAFRCKVCRPGGEYDFESNQPEAVCDGLGSNYLSSYFDFQPFNFEDPCDGGGIMSIITFDENNNAQRRSVVIPPNVTIDERRGARAFSGPSSQPGSSCNTMGWCLFDALHVYGFEFENGRRILATYSDTETCFDLPANDPDSPNNEGCDPEDPESCPPGFECIGGNCLQACNPEIGCIFGTCEDGYCVDDEEEESSDCDAGEYGIETDCTDCGFVVNEDGSCSSNLVCFNNNEVLGNFPAALSFCIQTQNGGASYSVVSFCPEDICNSNTEVISGGYTDVSDVYDDPEVNWIADLSLCPPCLNSFGENAENYYQSIDVNSSTRAQSSVSRYHANNNKTIREQLVEGKLKVYPNPFTSDINLVFNNSEEQFSGKIKLINGQGVEVMAMNYDFLTGENSLLLQDIDNLQPGLYTVIIFGNNGLIDSKNVIKM